MDMLSKNISRGKVLLCAFVVAALLSVSISASLHAGGVGGNAQDGIRTRISVDFEGVRLADALRRLESVSGVSISFRNSELPSTRVRAKLSNTRLQQALDRVLWGTGLVWEHNERGVRVFAPNEEIAETMASIRRNAGSQPVLASYYSAQYRYDDRRTTDRTYDRRDDRRTTDRRTDDRYRDDRYREPERRRIIPSPSLERRAAGLSSLIQGVITPGRWRERYITPREEELRRREELDRRDDVRDDVRRDTTRDRREFPEPRRDEPFEMYDRDFMW